MINLPKNLTLVGHFSVDSGTCWIGDPCYILHKEKLPETLGEDWSGFCKALQGMPPKPGKEFSFNHGGHGGLGVCTSTGVGDGTYPVYAVMRNREVAGLFIDFYGLMDNE